MMLTQKRYPINVGDIVYYTMDDDNGDTFVYSSKVTDIKEKEITIKDTPIFMTFYELESGLGVQRNACYTLEELCDLAERMTYLMYSMRDKDKNPQEIIDTVLQLDKFQTVKKEETL